LKLDMSRPGTSLWQPAPPGVPARAPWHPGRFLHRNYLAPMGLSQSQAARLLGLSRRRLHEVVHGQRAMTPDTAVRCAIVFRTDAMFWLALQAAWDSFHAWKNLRSCSQRVHVAN
jgi:addiction module HigA family antidote